ncbi:MAG TPA: TIGR01777 family oxidoreductase [Flavobacteriales bacterium]
MATILISGGSGLIGQRLTAALLRNGHTVRWLSRKPGGRNGVQAFAWDIHRRELDEAALKGVDHIVHLSGSGIADGRWTDQCLRELYASRVDAADLIRTTADRIGAAPASFISASGIGAYGTVTTDHIFRETDPPANDTIGKLVQAWEAAADRWSPQARVVKLRTPMVLAKEGGALPRLAAPVRWGLGAALGHGRQWMTWVHIDDLVDAYIRAIGDPRLEGAYNVVADEQMENRTFMKAVAKALRRPFFLPPVPAFALRLAFGEMSSILLEAPRANNARIQHTGFAFKHRTLLPALEQLLQ